MSIWPFLGKAAGVAAVAACALAVPASAAEAEKEGYVDVRVAEDHASCGTVVLKWPLGEEELCKACGKPIPVPTPEPKLASDIPEVDLPDVKAIVIEPVTEMAETTPVPVIHHHPALNAGGLYFPPSDVYYRHYSPEEADAPFTWRANREQYENHLRYTFPYYDSVGVRGVIVNPGVESPLPAEDVEATAETPGRVILNDGTVIVPAGAPNDVWAPGIKVAPSPRPQRRSR